MNKTFEVVVDQKNSVLAVIFIKNIFGHLTRQLFNIVQRIISVQRKFNAQH